MTSYNYSTIYTQFFSVISTDIMSVVMTYYLHNLQHNLKPSHITVISTVFRTPQHP